MGQDLVMDRVTEMRLLEFFSNFLTHVFSLFPSQILKNH